MHVWDSSTNRAVANGTEDGVVLGKTTKVPRGKQTSSKVDEADEEIAEADEEDDTAPDEENEYAANNKKAPMRRITLRTFLWCVKTATFLGRTYGEQYQNY